ncbi:protein kintoun [Chelonus insularis]|uniref:protein kintoun n=1 Tax=Chelonus insularis TaxID=460826 RepID=UPI00158AE7B0|nr:protein kintoun [Chelonus insularis]
MDACDTQRNNWEDLEVTKSELETLSDCMKQDEFRKLLIEYAEEVTNPENRKIYQEEITKLERERGVDVTFVNPEPGYVIKTSLNGEKKCFINISKSETIGKPSSQPSYENGHPGLNWSIPHTLTPPRDDLDNKRLRCTVFDVVFHPDTLYLASKNRRFREIVNNTALDGVEKNFKVVLDRKNLKFPKMTFKGMSQSAVIRKQCEKPPEKSSNNEDEEEEIYQKIMASYDEAREKYNKVLEGKPKRQSPKTIYYRHDTNIEDISSPYSTPKYVIKHQSDIDIQDFRNTKDSKLHATIPKNLVVSIDLPLLRSASDASLDVQEHSLLVLSEKPAKYRLELPLPYRVDPDHGNAKFDMTKKKLIITLPVLREAIQLPEFKDDSGVESDHGSPPATLITEQNAGVSCSNDHNQSLSTNNIDHEDSLNTDDGDNNTNCDNSNHKNTSNTLIREVSSDSNRSDDSGCKITDVIDEEPLMNENTIYSYPYYTCNIYDCTFALVIHVKNVDSGSIRYKFLHENCGIHITFSSVGAGFFPVYYSLCLKIEENAFNKDTITVEPWDNNVVFTVTLNELNKETTQYFVGLNEELMEAKDLPNKTSLIEKFESLVEENEKIEEIEKRVEVYRKNEEEVVINISPNENHPDSDDEDETCDRKKTDCNLQKYRSISESSGDELPSSNKNKSRGILKLHSSRRSNFSRSVSESSIDDTTGIPSSVDLNYDSVQEHYSESDCCSLKKTVRFNDVVSRQLFRSNSSILGRRKKNQRKLRKKKQAHERRMSESENSETEERDKFKANVHKNTKEEKAVDNVKSILNRNKTLNHRKSSSDNIKNNKKSENDINNMYINNAEWQKTEFKNDLIFDLDM